jgi:protein-disulfide isomerase
MSFDVVLSAANESAARRGVVTVRAARVAVALVGFAGFFGFGAGALQAQDSQVAYKIGGKATTLSEVYKEDQASFYDIEKKKFELIDRIAREKYLDYFWQNKAKETGKSVAEAKKIYEDKNVKVSEKEIQETMEKFKDHPSLKKLEKKDQEREIRDYLTERGRREVYDQIIEQGMKKGELVIAFPEPVEPVYKVTVNADDQVRYGPEASDTKPVSCKADDCPITIVEYSEFQCPFCVRVLPDTKRVLADYKGKIRWVVRDFPLSFHDRARPAAIAAKCAAAQGKYWQMYGTLFDNQRSLGDEDLVKYADKIGLDKAKYAKCTKNPGPVEALIDRNFQSGVALGVSGTPAFFINGRRLSGAMPYSEFKRIIDDELKGGKKS